MKNPHALIIFGQRYDGSNEVSITPSIATESSAGCVKPVAKTSDMIQNVGVDSSGKLYTRGVQVDNVVTAFSENAVSSNGVYQYGNQLVTQMQALVNTTKQNIDKEQVDERKKITDSLDATNAIVEQLKTSVGTNTSDISSLKTSVNQAKQDISSNSSEITAIKQKNTNQDTEISGIKTDITNQVKTLNDTITKTKSDIEADITSQVSSVSAKADNNAESISTLQSDLEAASNNITANKGSIDTNKTDISGLKTRCTNIEKDVSKCKSDISGLETEVAQNLAEIQTHDSQITNIEEDIKKNKNSIAVLQNQITGIFFDTRAELLSWVEVDANAKLLKTGAFLFINNNTSEYYVWNGTSAIRCIILQDVVGGYMQAQNPSGVGNFVMNGCTAGNYSTAIGDKNNVNSVYAFASGLGLIVNLDCGMAVGKYNSIPRDNEIFSIGNGEQNSRKTIMSVDNDGAQMNGGDITAYSDDYSAKDVCDISKATVKYNIYNADDMIGIIVEYNTFYQRIVLNDLNEYILTYNGSVWQSDSLIERSTYSDLSELGITFRYRDGTTGTPSITFVDGDTITIYAPPQGQISMRDMYTAFSKLHLYVDEDGDVCQED